MKTYVIATLQVEGTHRWFKCPFDDVSFLRFTHRHIFHIRVEKEVSHLDRETEIILLKRGIQKYIDAVYGTPARFQNMSCEMIADDLLHKFGLSSCEVLEDGENGGRVEI